MIWKSMVSPRAIAPASAHGSAMSCFASKTSEAVYDFASVVHNLMMDVRDTYRPELHYMRGPGPKWRAKHQHRQKFDPEWGGRQESSTGSLLRRNAANPV